MNPKRRIGSRLGVLGAVAAMLLSACAAGSGETSSTGDTAAATDTAAVSTTTTTTDEEPCAHVVDAALERTSSGFRVTATVRSGDTGWDRYADAWEVRDESGTVLATRVLAHPHVDEQPFTRSLDGVEIPDGVEIVNIAAHDSTNGFCGETVRVPVPEP